MLALATTTHRPELVDSLVLLATPWDFYADQGMVPAVMRPYEPQLRAYIHAQPFFAGEQVLAFFYFKDPLGYQQKLLEFAAAEARGDDVTGFLALEQWVNDCVNLSAPAASNCFCDFGLNNMALNGKWMVGSVPVIPESIAQRVLLAVPEHDTIVPPASSTPLLQRLPSVDSLKIDAGHVGMIAGSRAQQLLWSPLLEWLAQD
jgi:poly(3-hydroxyalkanoate) synthetase